MNNPKSIIEPLAGYLLDVIMKLRNKPFVPHSLTKLHNLKLCRDITDSSTVIEVGSFRGVTARRLSYLYDDVITIEIDAALHQSAKNTCRFRKNIQLILGDGVDELKRIAPKVNSAVLFLDGHFSGGETAMGDEPEPVLRELDAISDYIDSFNAVVVDDFRLFGRDPGWPSKSDVMKKLESVFPECNWTHLVLNDQFVTYRR